MSCKNSRYNLLWKFLDVNLSIVTFRHFGKEIHFPDFPASQHESSKVCNSVCKLPTNNDVKKN